MNIRNSELSKTNHAMQNHVVNSEASMQAKTTSNSRCKHKYLMFQDAFCQKTMGTWAWLQSRSVKHDPCTTESRWWSPEIIMPLCAGFSSSDPRSSVLTEGERSLYRLHSVPCGFSLLADIIFTVKISVVQWCDMDVANARISSDSQNASARPLSLSYFCIYLCNKIK